MTERQDIMNGKTFTRWAVVVAPVALLLGFIAADIWSVLHG